MGIENGSITLEDGREYITAPEYARRYNRDASGLREAVRTNRCGLLDQRRTILGTHVYPVDLIDQWRTEATSRKWVKGKPLTDVTKVARRYDLDRMMVVRALKAGRLNGRQDGAGTWRISDDDAAAWARDWLGILGPVESDG